MLDLWTQYDLPVLVELVRQLEGEGAHRVDTPLTVGALSETQVQAALRRLEAAGYIVGVATQLPYPVVITGVSERALRAVQAWPSPEAVVERLLGALAEAAEQGATTEERGRARRLLEAVGQVLTHCQKGHTATDVLKFFKQIDATVPRGLAVHVVLDNLSAHKAPEIIKWLAHKDRRRWHLHFTPTSSSWTNLIERWFKELTDRRLRRGVFTSVTELEDAIKLWANHWNTDPKPFVWKAAAADIIEKVQRGRAALTRQTNTTTDH